MLLKFRFAFVKVKNHLNDLLLTLNEGQMVYNHKVELFEYGNETTKSPYNFNCRTITNHKPIKKGTKIGKIYM